MEILSNYNLKDLNTFGVPARAKFFVSVNNESDLAALFHTPEFKNNKKLFLGKGSNILFCEDYDGLVVQVALLGKRIVSEDEREVVIEVGAGEDWPELVRYVSGKGWWGLENLASIPGSVGAAPVQNIGAYGADIKDVLKYVEVWDSKTGETSKVTNEDFRGGYRTSIFKSEFKNRFIILRVVLRLGKRPQPNLKYRSLREYVEQNKIDTGDPSAISEAVSEIRKEKLPDPTVIKNAGSFFKNIIIDEQKFSEMQKQYPDIPHFRDENGIKIPAGWLIEQCGFKGKRSGKVGVYDKHALVLVNHDHGSGREIKDLAEAIQTAVFDKFGLTLVPEVNLI